MAKKKSGNNMGLILTLVFFVIATFATGLVAYFGYEEIETHKGKAVEAKKKEDAMALQYREERVRKAMLRIAIGSEEPGDRVLIVQELGPLQGPIKDEHDRIRRSMGDNKNIPQIPDDRPGGGGKIVSAFDWPLISQTPANVAKDFEGKDATTIAGDPAVKPLRYIPDMLKEHRIAREQAEQQRKDAEDKMANFKKGSENLGEEKKQIAAQFATDLAKLDAATKAKNDALQKAFDGLVAKHAADANNAIAKAAKLGVDDNNKADIIAQQNDKIKQLTDLVGKLQASISGGSNRAVGVDFVNLEEKKGEIVRREEGGYVIINIGSAKRLKPQIPFLVVSADVSWLALQEKEKSLDRNNTRLDRQPYEDNPYVKAGIEVVEIISTDSARCKIIFENEPIRNPVQVRDGIFNISWQPDEEIRIAFAGIIDLDGDGLDNNEDFLRLLERQGVIVDEYLKMKPLGFVKRDGKGMSLRTRYLVMAPDPRYDAIGQGGKAQSDQIALFNEQLSEIRERAKRDGVQIIEARKFLAMIGQKLPRNPSPPQYGAAAYIQSAQPLMEKKEN